MKRTYEAWEEPDRQEITMSSLRGIMSDRKKGLVHPKAKLLFRFQACTPEEASAIFNIRMGFGPYFPLGKAKRCPNRCGAWYYPEGSGQCRNCGDVGGMNKFHRRIETVPENVKRIGVQPAPGFLYFIDKKGDISRIKMARGRAGGKSEKVAKVGIKKRKGYFYYLNKQGDACRVKMHKAPAV